MVEKKEKLLLLFVLGIVFVLLTNVDINVQNNDKTNEIKLSNDRVIGSPIFIDDTDNSTYWSKTAAENEWCSGSGTWSDPYVIKDLIIASPYQISCIEIKNSNVPFIIQNCELFPDPQNYFGNGIKLENVNNCKILENDIHSFEGENVAAIASWVSSNNNTILRNVIYDNVNSIYFTDGEKNNISENKVTNSLRFSIYLAGGKNNYIFNNNVTELSYSNILGGIHLDWTTENIVKGNTITASFYSGIWLRNSPRNNITENIVKNNGGFGIYLSDSDQNILLKNDIENNANTPLLLSDSNDNLILRNRIVGYDKCIQEVNSYDNTITGNSLYWLDLAPILIDDTNPLKDWAYTANNYEWCSGWGTSDSPYIIENVTINGLNAGNCIEIINSYRKFIIRDSTFFNSGPSVRTAGVMLFNVSQGKILNNNIYNHRGHGIYQSTSDHNVVMENKIGSNEFGIGLLYCNVTLIVNNTANNNNYGGIIVEWSEDIQLEGNNASGNMYGIVLDNTDNSKLMGNTLIDNEWFGLELANVNNTFIAGNEIKNSAAGLFIQKTFRSRIWQNSIKFNLNGGMILIECTESDISGNDVSQNDEIGIFLGYSENNKIIGNTIVSNYHGLYLENMHYNSITGNNISNNKGYGILLYDDVTSNIFVENQIMYNNEGFATFPNNNSFSNVIYQNKFIGNQINAIDNSFQPTFPFNLEWYRIWGTDNYVLDVGLDLAIDSSGNSYVVGYVGEEQCDMVLSKFDFNGSLEWQTVLDTSDSWFGYSVNLDEFDNIIVAGVVSGTGYSGNFIYTYNNYGELIGNKTWDIDGAQTKDSVIDSEGNLFVTGKLGGSGADILLVKFNEANDIEWYKTYSKSGYQVGEGIVIDDNTDDIYIVGSGINATTGDWETIVVKYDKAGNQIWDEVYPTKYNEKSNGMAIDNKGDIYVTGYITDLQGYQNIAILKIDSSGNLVWNKTWEGVYYSIGTDVATDDLGNLYVVGYGSNDPFYDIILLKFDNMGNFLWNLTWGDMGVDISASVEIGSFGDIYISGTYDNWGPGTYGNHLLLKVLDLYPNYWNNIKIGNYWDDYLGDDLDDDGIGDSPYLISGSAGLLDFLPIFSDKEELFMDIIPQFINGYMGDDLNFAIELTDYFGNDVDLMMDIVEEKAYWDAHNSVRTHFNSLTNYSGTIFHNETGTPSFSTLADLSLLNFTTYPYGSLLVAPEILEYNPTTQYSRQKIEIYFQLDLEHLFSLYNLELKDISYLNATLFGANFLELDYISSLTEFFGRIEVYNYLTDSYLTLSDYIFDKALELGNVNNLLKSENIADYSFGFIADELLKYVDLDNMITFRFFSYFEGYLNNPGDSYLSNFIENSVLGTLLDYISFDVVWWENTPEKVYYTETNPAYSNTIYTYNPTCPGTYTITFKVRPSANYKTVESSYTIFVKRRPVNITLDIPSQAYTTENIDVIANITDYLTTSPAINVKVNFYSDYYGSVTLLGSSVSDSYGIASISISRLYAGDHSIFAEVEENNGRYFEPYKDERFDNDIWAHTISVSYPIHIDLASTSLELLSLAPEGYNVIVGQNFYVFPRFLDSTTGLEIYQEEIKVYVNSTLIGLYNSSTPFLINFAKPGEQIVQCYFVGSELYETIETTTIFITKRLELSMIDISPDESLYFPNQQINITVFAKDLATNSPINGLNVTLYNNQTSLSASGLTKPDGTITYTIVIPYDWASEVVTFYALNSPIVDTYLQRKTIEFSIRISPFNTSVLLNINETELYVDEDYTLNFELWNLDLLDFVDDELILVTIYEEYPGDLPRYTNLELITSYNNSLVCTFSRAGMYNIAVSYYGSDLFLQYFSDFVFEILKRPTYITVDITDMEFVPGNNFSITVNLRDVFTDELLLNKYLNVSENIYDNGTLVVTKVPFEINTQFTNTFLWQPLREADFEFLFSFESDGDVYQNSSHSILLSVEKRQVWIESYIQSYNYRIGDVIYINTTFIDLNATHSDVIPDFLVHYLILEGENIIYSENHTSKENGVIDFEWQIPPDLINKTLTILLITAETNYFQSTFRVLEVSTSPLETYFNIILQPNPHGYINEEIILEVELFSSRGDKIEEDINYEIICEELLYHEIGTLNLGVTSTLYKTFPEAGKYIINFYYLGSEIYDRTETEITYYIELYPSTLNLIDYPEILYSADQTVNLTYQLIDALTFEPISGSLVKLFYIDIASSTKVPLGLEATTYLEGKVNFLAMLPDTYGDTSIIFVAEVDRTASHQGASNSVELFITESPTFINFATPTGSYQYYIDDNLNMTLELYDYFENLLITETLYLEIETPTNYLTLVISCNQIIQLNFTEFGLYRVNASYRGSSFNLPTSAEIYYGVSPIPTSLEFIEIIPPIIYTNQYLFLKARLENNITAMPIVGESVKFYVTNNTSTFLIYEGITDNEGLISYIWDVDQAFIGQNIRISAVYDYVYYFENCSSPKISTYISKYDIELQLLDFPDLLSPFVEEHFIIEAYKNSNPSGVAQNCHIQLFLLLSNGTHVLINSGFTDDSGVLEFDWTPYYDIFYFNEASFEIYVIEDDQYYGGLILTKEITIDKLMTFISIIPEDFQVLPGELISVHFEMVDNYGMELYGQVIYVEIKNPLYSSYFEIKVGVNDTYEFLVPNYGAFEIVGLYEGTDRYHPSSNETIIYSDKFELEIELSILEAFAQNQTISFLGTHWNYSILDFHQNFTLVANVSIKQYNIPMEGAEVYFYFIQKSGDVIFIGSNVTNKEGIAMYYWDTSNFSSPKWWHPSALIAKVPESLYNYPSESNPIYFSFRKIHTLIAIETFTSKFRVNIDYKINISLYDEFLIKLKGYNISVNIYFSGKIVDSYNLIANDTSYFNFTPSKCGNYIIKASFAGTEEYKASSKTEKHKCVEKEPTNLEILLPDNIQPGQLYSIKVILFNSTGAVLTGELVELTIIYHDDSGNTQYYYMNVIIGENNTFDWTFPEYDKFVIKALYLGTDDYLGCKVVTQSKSLIIFSFSFWEIFFFLLMPGIMITPSLKTKTSKGKRRKRIFTAIFLILMLLFSSYAGIAFICSQIETTGIIRDLKGISNYNPNSPLNKGQSTMNDLFEFGASKLEKLNNEWIPTMENDSAAYDLITENSTIIPPEFDEIPPELEFVDIPNGVSLQGKVPIKVMAFDRESGIHKVLFKLLYSGMNLVEENIFTYNFDEDLYIYNLSTTGYTDGEYEIYAIAIDNNNNNYTTSIEIKITNNPVYDVSEDDFEFVTVELTDYVNVSFISSVSGSYTLKVVDKNYNTITTLSGLVNAEEMNTLEISINPIVFKAKDYKILLTVFMINSLGFLKSETQEIDLKVLKESVKLELDVIEGEDIYTNHYINFRARLVELDGEITDTGEILEKQSEIPISGQVLTFRIGDSDNQQILGSAVTDIDGYATFNFNVSLSKGQHVFIVKFQGNNIYQPLEETKLFENKGVFTDIKLTYVRTPVPYNEIATIKAGLFADEDVIPHQTLYFNISNTLENRYIGMAMTDSNGEATIMFPCDYLPGSYNIIVTYDGKSIYANNVSIFKDRLEIITQNVDISIETGDGSIIYCPYYYNTTLVAKLLVEDTDIAIKGIIINFELILNPAGTRDQIGTAVTDSNGLARIDFNPSSINNLDPDTYTLDVFSTSNEFYNNDSDLSDVVISQDIPIISIQGTESSFFTEFQIYATLSDSQLNPINGEFLHFSIINSSNGEILHVDTALTDFSGEASIFVEPEDFPYVGEFDILVFYSGNYIYLFSQSVVKHGLKVNYHTTQLLIQGPEKGSVIDPYEFEVLLIDSQGTPITDQMILVECYKEAEITNLIEPNTYITTDSIYGNATYSLNLNIIGTFFIKVYYLPLLDGDSDNDGFLQSQNKLKFIIERAAADLSITKMNKPRIMRGDQFIFTVEAGLKEAKREIIPINVFVNIDLNGDGIKHDDIYRGKYSYIINGKAVISYIIPIDDTFQAGQYRFTIVIDDEWSIFTGNTSLLIDFVERTTLEIKYHILNPRSEGKHYIGEQENIEFILLDEDDDPLPASTITYNGSILNINRFIQYQIVNGKNIYDSIEVGLDDGNFTVEHRPAAFGFETCTIMYEGDRFFTPSTSRKVAEIIRRPLILTFIDYRHNNQDRLNAQHTGHRGETITVFARVQDYLNESYLENQIVYFGHNGKFLDVSNKSSVDGWTTIVVDLNEKNNLIQAGDYHLSLLIEMNDRYKSIMASHSELLHVFEIGHISINFGDISMEDMNYVIKPTITFYDEDNQVLRNLEFFVQLADKESGIVAYENTMTSGLIEIPVFDSGVYELVVVFANNDVSASLNIHEIASYFIESFYVFSLTESEVKIKDSYITPLWIPLISEVLTYALQLSTTWDAHIVTYTILLVINIFSGSLGQTIRISWETLIKLVCLSLFCGMLTKMKYYLFGVISRVGVQIALTAVVGKLNDPEWLLSAVIFIIGGLSALLAAFVNRPEKAEKRAKKQGVQLQKSIDVNIILLELGILSLAGIIEYIFSFAIGAWGLLGSFIGSIPYSLWLGYHNFYALVKAMSFATLLLLIIANAFISLVLDLIWLFIPKDGGIWGFISDLARYLLKISLTFLVFALINIYFGFTTVTIGYFFTQLVKSIFIDFILGIIIQIFLESYQFTSVFKHTTLPKVRIQ